MNKKQYKRRRDIKSKLMAAICMLLVSSIMMVSTTYAWFTLSTAPEVTGINTAVGANGNLEMALLPREANLSALDTQITSSQNDSMDGSKTVPEANITWGNLVDVSSNDVYGLNKITLMPSKLNASAATANSKGVIGAQPLSTPKYGADGRVNGLENKTITAIHVDNKFAGENMYGVRAVGTSSSMSDRQLAHREAKATALNATTAARNAASLSLTTNGAALAGIAVKHATAGGGDTYTQAEVDVLKDVVTKLQQSVESIETAMKQMILANSIAPATVTDAEIQTITDTITAADLYSYKTAPAAETKVLVPAALTGDAGYIAKLATTKANVQAAATALAGLTGEASYPWADISAAMGQLINTESENLTLCGIAISQVTAKDEKGNFVHMNTITSQAFSPGGVPMVMGSGSGVYAEIADFCGDYQSGITLDLNIPGIGTFNGIPATMKTAGVQPCYLNNVSVADYDNGTGAAASAAISDYYGYIIDLAFRTNAADSFLMLQTSPVDRVYADNTANERTMGGGSTMTFTTADINAFPTAGVKKLMGAMRIVFFDTQTREIISEARLGNLVDSSASSVTGDILLWNGTAFVDEADANLVKLDQNKAKAVSVLVYLDGENITNADVANSELSMTGTMNLQFSSSANLKPMEYTDLRRGTTDSGSTPSTPAATPVTNATVTSTVDGITKGAAVLSEGKVVVQLNGWAEDTAATVTMKIGEGNAETVTPAQVDGKWGVSMTAPEGFDAATTAVVVTVSPT